MKFAELYTQSKDKVAKSLKALWCTNIKNQSQASYAKQINRIIDHLFASEDYMPVVQCMDSYEPILETELNNANKYVDGLWTKKFLPYKHQYKSWKALSEKTVDDKVKSIVVTTGTGSGKTECFMLPLVADLKRLHKDDNYTTHQIEAIFLYPLNALIEDQKERLSKLLEGTGLTFAVYNSSLPEEEDLNDDRTFFPGEITSRQEMRSTPPNILLTNPTMLEYMMLRQNDQGLLSPGSLKWVVLDETHTYTGASATELAMLLRRVLDAFQVKTKDVRFATSSATIDSKSGDAEKQSLNLREFVTSLCGLDISQVEHVEGRRLYDEFEEVPFAKSKKHLLDKDFVRLDELVPGDNYSIEERLKILDEWCDTSIFGKNALRAKVHYFFRVPDNGLFVKLTEHQEGHFKIYDKLPLQEYKDDHPPYLELVRCDSCGEYFAIAQQYAGGKYRMPEQSIDDIFNIEDEHEDTSSGGRNVVFALTNKSTVDGKNTGNSFVSVKSNEVKTEKERPNEEWVIIRNVSKKCPHCSSSLYRKSESGVGDEENEDFEKFHTFRLSSDFISRLISEPVLNQLKSHGPDFPHNGQQYISFVDSRQAAAKSTLGQNLEQEMLWCYSRIFHELCRLYDNNKDTIKNRQKLETQGWDVATIDSMLPLKNYLTWIDILRLLKNDSKICQMMCMQFFNRSRGSDEVDEHTGELKNHTVNLYLCSLLWEKLAKHPRKSASPETMGLFTSYFPKLDKKITQLPSEVEEFNNKLPINNRITLSDWKDLLQMYLDFRVRSDGSIRMKLNDEFSDFNIFDCQRFQSSKQGRRAASKPQIDTKNGQYAIVVRLLAALYDEGYDVEVIKKHKKELSSVIDALWRDLTDTTGLLVDENQAKRNSEGYIPSYRLNVADIAFKLYDKYCLCDAREKYSQGMVPRPIALTFKGYSPYLINKRPCKPLTDIVDCDVFPYYWEAKTKLNAEEFNTWKKAHRKLLCENIGDYNNKIWGDDGVFSTRLDSIYLYSNIYIQAEHTAQIDKIVATQSQELFKNYGINILACSTTMEMGVDLGSLEFVLLSSIPPHTSNYKQRAGRSGRNDSTRSACATLCKSDSLGLRTLYNPLQQLINRTIQTPTVDMNCRKVILRHINSYLLRDFIFKYQPNPRCSNLELEVIDFFTYFDFFRKENRRGRYNKDYYNIAHKDDNSRRIFPNDAMGMSEDLNRTLYSKFIDYLNDNLTNDQGVKIDLNINGVNRLLKGITCVSCQDAIDNTIEQIEICFNDLKSRFEYIRKKYNPDEAKAKRKWSVEYRGLLAKNLLTYLSTNRFTPNANMPVDVVAFRQRPNETQINTFNSDPSYQLVQALSMYSPGNTIIISNRTRVVRGIRYNEHKPKVFSDLYYNGEKATIQEEPANAVTWGINKKKALKVIQPIAFLPDVNESEMRYFSQNPYTQVDAQLVDPEDWDDEQTPHLYSIRRSKDKGNSKILYYNKGKGYGYCVCSLCGRTVMEHYPVKPNRFNPAPFDMNNKETQNSEIRFHYNLSEKGVICCSDKEQEDVLYRNIILGAEIQTDYCELKFKHSINGSWINKTERSLLITLGVVMTNKLIEYLDKERGDIDFLVTLNAHLCIYDTSSGGSGYSTELIKPVVIKHVLNQTYILLKSSKSRDEILDKFTYKYLNLIDIKSAISWLEAELAIN